MIRAILFDFDGVLADTEPLHLQMFQEILQEEGILLTKEDYFEHYLGLDDHACFEQVFKDHGKSLEPELSDRLVRKKNEKVLQTLKNRYFLLPEVPPLLKTLKGSYYLAVVSGALRSEVEEALRGGKRGPDVGGFFQVIIGADDVQRGKPDPDGYKLALKLFNRDHVPSSEVLLAHECLVIEDSPWGITAAKRAGMKCIGITNSYGEERLQEADQIIHSLTEATSLLAKFF